MDIALRPKSAGLASLWHVSSDLWKRFSVFLPLFWQQKLVVSCELTIATATLWMNLSNDKICQVSNLVLSISAFWNELRSVAWILTSESSCVWYVLHGIIPSYRRVLTLLCFADMSRCAFFLPTRLWKHGASCLDILFRNKVEFLTSSLLLSTQSTSDCLVVSVWLTTLFPLRVLLISNCLSLEIANLSWSLNISQVGRTLLRKRIEKFSELFLLEFRAQFHDRKLECLCLHSTLVQELRIMVVRLQKFSQFSLISLPIGSATRLLCHSLSILSNWILLCWGGF